MQLLTHRFKTVAVRLPDGAKAGMEFPFPDQDDLRGALIDAVETFTSSDVKFTDAGLPVVGDTDAVSLVFTLREASDARVKWLPYLASRAAILAGVLRRLAGWSATWPQCRIRLVGDLPAGEGDKYAYFGVHYRFPADR